MFTLGSITTGRLRCWYRVCMAALRYISLTFFKFRKLRLQKGSRGSRRVVLYNAHTVPKKTQCTIVIRHFLINSSQKCNTALKLSKTAHVHCAQLQCTVSCDDTTQGAALHRRRQCGCDAQAAVPADVEAPFRASWP